MAEWQPDRVMLENQQAGRMLDLFVSARIPDVSGDASAGILCQAMLCEVGRSCFLWLS